MKIQDLKYANLENTAVDCMIEHPTLGWIPTTVTNTSEDGRTDLIAQVFFGSYPIAPFEERVKSPEEVLYEAKMERDEGQYLPIEVDELVFDAHFDAQRNIAWAVQKFEVLDELTRGDGTLDWTLADDSIVTVTKQTLIKLEDAIVIRKAILHKNYSQLKNGG